MYELNTSWILWYHSIRDTTWTKSSYKQFYTFNNLYDYKLFEELIQLNHLQNGMFFLMRKGIFPNWEDPDNSEGCCISFKIPGQTIKEEFCKILLYSESALSIFPSKINISASFILAIPRLLSSSIAF